jgi:hypothetical protein
MVSREDYDILREPVGDLSDRILNLISLPFDIVRQHFRIIFGFLLAIVLLIWLPSFQVSQYEINNAATEASLENQYRATLAQILGGVAIGIGLYYTWRRIIIAEDNLKVAQDNLRISQEGQITERFTRAIDQLGNEKMEIRLGGIYALERIAQESEKDYWPIMEILTAYIRKNSAIESENTNIDAVKNQNKVSLDIQAILTVIGRRRYHYSCEYNSLDLHKTYLLGADLGWAYLGGINLERADLEGANLERANLGGANLRGANLERANLEEVNIKGAKLEEAYLGGAYLEKANLEGAYLEKANLGGAYLREANLGEVKLEGANLEKANLEMANLEMANLEEAYLGGAKLGRANLERVNFERANLEGVCGLSINQLSKAKTLYNAKLDEKLLIPLKKEYPNLFEKN